ncbi:hypothetical protein ACTFIR_009492 [Dictyostelium discoideum]
MKPIKNNKFSDDELSSSSSSSDFGSDDEPINVNNNNNNKINNKKGGKNSKYNEPMEEDEDDEELDIGDETLTSNNNNNNNNNSGVKNKNKNEDEDEEFNEDEDEEFNEDEEDLEDEEEDEEDEEIEGNNKNNNNNLIGTSRQKDMKRSSGGRLNSKLLAPIPQEVKKIKVLTDEMKQKKSEIALYRRNKKIEEDEASMRDVVNQLFYRKAASKETSAEDEKKPSRHDLFLKQINGKTVCYKDDIDNGKTISYPIGHPMIEQIEKDKELSKNTATTTTTTVKINTPIKCSVLNCNNIKRYNCPKNNLPVCTYECWQKVMNTPVTTTTSTNLQ